MLALTIVGLDATAASAATGSGAVYDLKVGNESVSIFSTIRNGQLVLHVRNVGRSSIRVQLTPRCAPGASCGSPSTVSVNPVAAQGDAGKDATVTFPSGTLTFVWSILA
jgi:diaminopimelate epimerase